VLEIGAGTLNHIAYEPAAESYDIVEPMADLYADSAHKTKLRAAYTDVSEIPLESKYDKIVSIAAFEHVEALPELLARLGLLLQESGRLCIGIPSEGGFLWGASWRCTTGILFKLRTGLPYEPFIRYEHINDAEEIIDLVKIYFEDVKVRRFPLPWLHLSFYSYIEATEPNLEICQTFITENTAP
jgi:SAM-dependent methyltransferase